jgi:hypothetical protein
MNVEQSEWDTLHNQVALAIGNAEVTGAVLAVVRSYVEALTADHAGCEWTVNHQIDRAEKAEAEVAALRAVKGDIAVCVEVAYRRGGSGVPEAAERVRAALGVTE